MILPLSNLFAVHADSLELRGERYATTPADQDDVDEEDKLKEESMMYTRLKVFSHYMLIILRP